MVDSKENHWEDLKRERERERERKRDTPNNEIIT